jgi:hypothetical protein
MPMDKFMPADFNPGLIQMALLPGFLPDFPIEIETTAFLPRHPMNGNNIHDGEFSEKNRRSSHEGARKDQISGQRDLCKVRKNHWSVSARNTGKNRERNPEGSAVIYPVFKSKHENL